MTARRPSPRAVTAQEARREPQKPVQPPAPACAAPLTGPSWHRARPRARAGSVRGLASPSPRSALRTQPEVVAAPGIRLGRRCLQSGSKPLVKTFGRLKEDFIAVFLRERERERERFILLNTNQRLSPPTSLSSSPTSFISPRGILNETHPSSDTKAALMKPHLFFREKLVESEGDARDSHECLAFFDLRSLHELERHHWQLRLTRTGRM